MVEFRYCPLKFFKTITHYSAKEANLLLAIKMVAKLNRLIIYKDTVHHFTAQICSYVYSTALLETINLPLPVVAIESQTTTHYRLLLPPPSLSFLLCFLSLLFHF